jgi:hypothetical protein
MVLAHPSNQIGVREQFAAAVRSLRGEEVFKMHDGAGKQNASRFSFFAVNDSDSRYEQVKANDGSCLRPRGSE